MFNLWPLLLVLSLGTTEKNPPPFSWQPPLRCLNASSCFSKASPSSRVPLPGPALRRALPALRPRAAARPAPGRGRQTAAAPATRARRARDLPRAAAACGLRLTDRQTGRQTAAPPQHRHRASRHRHSTDTAQRYRAERSGTAHSGTAQGSATEHRGTGSRRRTSSTQCWEPRPAALPGDVGGAGDRCLVLPASGEPAS